MPFHNPLMKGLVTTDVQTMIPAFMAHATWLGFIYTLDPFHRINQLASLTFARQLLPMQLWGAMFFAMAVLMVLGWMRRSRQLFVFSLYCYAVVMFWWACIYGVSAALSPAAPVTTVGWPLFVAIACHASAKSILRGER